MIAGVSVALPCLLALQLHGLSTSMGFSWALASQALRPRAGEAESLPVEIVQAIGLVSAERGRLRDGLRLGKSMATDPLMRQRAFEALYPIRVSEQSDVVLARRGDLTVRDCKEFRHASHVGLYDCRLD